MTIQDFIQSKAGILTRYVEGYWHEDISYAELQRFLWDTLEEWTAENKGRTEAYSHQERIFWHVFYLLQNMTENEISDGDKKDELMFLMEFLDGKNLCPIDVVGMRP